MQNSIEKIKIWFWLRGKLVAFCAIIFVVTSLSFGLGYLANREFSHAPIIIEKCSESGTPPLSDGR
jgi:hypothetical protein